MPLTPPPPQVQLIDRLSDALGAHDATPEQRRLVQDAYMDAGMEEAVWDDLPDEVKRTVEEIERLPRTMWYDPSDAPGGEV
jgi:hypothetical protein